MHIPALRSKSNYEVVLWDTGSDTNYVRLEHAQNQGFPYKLEWCVVMTVGDQLEERTLPVYKCHIKDLHGKFLEFFTMVLPRITGDMFCPLTGVQLKELFPRVQGVENLGVH